MTIIQADKRHIEQIIELVSALLTKLGGKPFTVDAYPAAAFLEQALDSGAYTAFLALDEKSQAVGILSVGDSGAVYTGGAFGVIHEFYLTPGSRSKGIGKQWMGRAKQLAVERSWKRLEVGAPPYSEWQRTYAFYRRYGFQEIGPRLKWLAD